MKRKRRQLRPTPARRPRELGGFLLAAAALLAGVSDATATGVVGREVHRALDWLVGLSALPLLALVALVGLRRAVGRKPDGRYGKTLALLLLLLPLVAAMTAPGRDWAAPGAGGALGHGLDRLLVGAFGVAGRDVLAVVGVLLLGILWVEGFLGRVGAGLARIPRGLRRLGQRLVDFLYEDVSDEPSADGEAEVTPAPPPAPPTAVPEVSDEPAELDAEPLAPTLPRPVRAARRIHRQGRFLLPSLDLLRPGASGARRSRDAQEKARLLVETLASFGVHVRVLDTVEGPVVTRFELQPAPGVKVSRIVSLADDIALAMAATDVRIEAPIPGKAAVGIEIPNTEAAPVVLRDVLDSEAFRSSPSPLTVALGKDISGRPVVAALDRMPHLLIAGATGSGKSVCLNSIILSLLFRNVPDDLRLLLIDPKVVELQPFDGIPHLYAPLVTDPKRAAGVLRRMVREMEHRYRLFAEAGVRDLERYNEQAEERLPKIVVVIDELADLMMVAPVDVEDAICRLAQMARAAGIHLVVATQRPSVDVITGLIKANIPSRIAFAVSSQVDSRTILDQGGAEKLLGKGDMLFAPMGRAKPLRAQGAYVDDSEVEAVAAFWREQAEPDFAEDLLAAEDEPGGDDDDLDELFPDAVRVVVEARQASASLLQRRLRVGYARAARIVEQMEQKGIVGPQDGARPREVRLSLADYERMFGRGEADPSS